MLEQSSDTASNAQVGVYEWFPREDSGYVEPFAEASFKTPVGTYSEPVQTEFGYHIIKVLGKEVRALTQTQIDTKKQKLYDDWFQEAKRAATISPASFQAPTPTPPPLVEPTTPPSTNPTLTATPAQTGATPGASQPVSDTNTGATPAAPNSTATPTAGATGRNTPVPAATP